MSISLKKIELSNLRTHKHLVFEPAEEGLTSISGANGTGKSSIVDSIAWALFGTKPKGVSKVSAIVRDGSVFPKDKTFAIVYLNVAGREIKVERRIISKNGAVECEVYEANTKNEWNSIAGPSVSHAEPQIRKILSMDEAGFLAAVLVQQKQVDQLINASPPERAKVIEKLTGIASITAALKEASQEHKALKKIAASSDVDESLLEKLKKDLSQTREALHKKTELVNKLLAEEKTLKTEGIALREKVANSEQALSAAVSAKEQIAALTATIAALEKDFERLQTERKAMKAKLSSLAMSNSKEEVDRQEQELRNKQIKFTEDIFTVKNSLLSLAENREKYEEVLEVSRVKDLEGAEAGLEQQTKKLDKLAKQEHQIKNTIAASGAQEDSIANAISVIRDSHGECPTCLQTVKDVKSAVESLEAQVAGLVEKREKASATLDKNRKNSTETESAIEKFELLIESLKGLETAGEEEKRLTAELTSLTSEQKVLDKELNAIRKIQSELLAQQEMKEAYDRVYRQAQATMSSIDENKDKLAKAEDLVKVKVNQKELERDKIKLEKSRAKYLEITNKLTEEKGEVKLYSERKTYISEKVAAQEKEIERHRELLKKIEISANSVAVIDEFRRDRIENSIPLLEAYASDLLNRFTEGKFIQLKLDTKFNATVMLANGNERAVGLLSGGELSAASMSLRLAISLMLNGGASQNLMVLDEVLVSQDAARAESILATIQDVCKGQVVLIAHNDSINGIADKVVTLS